MAFVDALRALNMMTAERVVLQYAITGGMAIVFWAEPTATFDLDVLVDLPQAARALISLEPIYEWARAHGYPSQEEHVLIEGLPTQFLPAPNALAREALYAARELHYNDVSVRVVAPEYLVALCLEPSARTPRRRERAAMLMELSDLDRALVDDILGRYGLVF